MTAAEPDSSAPRDRRKVLLAVAGVLVAVALVALVVAMFTGGDEEADEPAAPVIQPLVLTAPPDTTGFIGVDGNPATPNPGEVEKVLAAITGYLKEATVTPLSTPRAATSTTAPPGTADVATYFTEAAAGQIETVDGLTLSDRHLPFASDGVSTSTLTVALGGVMQDGAPQFVNATINVVMVAKGDQDVTISRTGELVLRPVDGQWKIAGYKLVVERALGDLTSTTEAAFG